MATHFTALAWRIPGVGEPGGLLSMGSHRVGHDWSDLAAVAAGYTVYTVLSHVQLCMTPGTVAHRAPLSMWIPQARILEWVACHSLLQGIFPSQGWNPSLLHCRWMLYLLSHSTWNSTPCSVMAYMGKNLKKVDICICITDSLCYTLEANTTVWINYTLIIVFLKNGSIKMP